MRSRRTQGSSMAEAGLALSNSVLMHSVQQVSWRDRTNQPCSRAAESKLVCVRFKRLACQTVAEPLSKVMPRPGVTDMSPARAPDLGATVACTTLRDSGAAFKAQLLLRSRQTEPPGACQSASRLPTSVIPHILFDRVMLVSMLTPISGSSLMMSGSDLSGRDVGFRHVTVPAWPAATEG